LVLTTVDPLQAVDRATIVTSLADLGLLGAPLPEPEATFGTGPAFARLVAFTGCAVQFGEPAAGGSAPGPWLRVPAPLSTPRLLWGRNTRPPRCPACATPLRDWAAPLAPLPSPEHPGSGCDATLRLACTACGLLAPAYAWRWGRHAGAGRSFVTIEEVFPGEGRPLPALMQSLGAVGAGAWDFFYVQDCA
jgi:hypothetical protein